MTVVMEQFQGQQGGVTMDTSQQTFHQMQPIMMQGLPGLQFIQTGQFPAALQAGQQQVRQTELACTRGPLGIMPVGTHTQYTHICARPISFVLAY